MPKTTWVNGKFVDSLQPALGVHERGFLYGDGLFETIRIRNRRPCCWEAHRARLRGGCVRLQIPFPAAEVEAGVRETSGRLENGFLRLTVSRGPSPGRGLLPAVARATVVVSGYGGDPYPEEAYEKGFRACLISFPRNSRSPLVGLKSLNCLENILGKMEAAAAGVDEGIFVNDRGEIAEGTTSNIFLFTRGRLLTPPPACGLLPGIMRARVLRLARRWGMAVAEEKFYPPGLYEAEESFLTNSLLEVMPLVSFNGQPLGAGRPGKLSRRLRRELQRSCSK